MVPSFRVQVAILLALLALDGLSAQEEEPQPGAAGPVEFVQYLSKDGVVYGSIVRDSQGSVIRRETYIRGRDGRVAEILLGLPDGSITRLGTSSGRDWIEYPNGSEIFRVYYPDGRLKVEEERASGSVVRRESYTYEGNTPRIAAMTRELPVEGTRQEILYTTSGLPSTERCFFKDGGSKVLSYLYDDQNRITEIRTLSGRTTTRVTYAYAEDGTETEEAFDSLGSIRSRRTTHSDGSYEVESFDAGRLFARVFYRDGRKVREEILTEGGAVRVREFP